jgi:hypothetical protein
MGCARCPMSWEARVGRWQALGEIQIREVLPGEYRDTGSLIQRAYAEYARPSDPLWAEYFGMLADVARRAAVATVLVAVAGGRIVGTATVELDRTLEGAEDLQPGQANFRLLAVDPVAGGAAWAGGWSKHAWRSLAGPGSRLPRCTPPSRWWSLSVSTGPWASGASRPARLSPTLIWSCKPSGFRFGQWSEEMRITPRIQELIAAGRHGRCRPPG